MFQKYGIEVLVNDRASAKLRGIASEAKTSVSALGRLNGSNTRQLEGGMARLSNASNGLTSSFGRLSLMGGAVATGFAIAGAGVVKFGRDVISVTSEMESYEAVLTNLTGSNRIAQKAMADIKSFAVATPFEVNDLTNAYVKLTNRGYNPTIQSMREYGDLAAANKKSFLDLTEAVLDLEVGQTRRFEEIGYATQMLDKGRKLSIMFKGQTYVIDRNKESIIALLKKFGNAKGVMGTMAAISATMGGQISNLKDSYNSVANTVGTQFRPAIMGGISAIGDMLRQTETWLRKNPELIGQLATATVAVGQFTGSIFKLSTWGISSTLLPVLSGAVSIFGGVADAGNKLLSWADRQTAAFTGLSNSASGFLSIFGGLMNLKGLSVDNVSNSITGTLRGVRNVLAGEGLDVVGEFKDGFYQDFNASIKRKLDDVEKKTVAARAELAQAYGVKSYDDISVGGTKQKTKLGALGVNQGYKELGYDGKEDIVSFLYRKADEQRTKNPMSTLGVPPSSGLDSLTESSQKGKNAEGLSPVIGDRKESRNITINIDKMIESFEVHTNNYREGIGKAADMVQEALLKAISDTQLMTQ